MSAWAFVQQEYNFPTFFYSPRPLQDVFTTNGDAACLGRGLETERKHSVRSDHELVALSEEPWLFLTAPETSAPPQPSNQLVQARRGPHDPNLRAVPLSRVS